MTMRAPRIHRWSPRVDDRCRFVLSGPGWAPLPGAGPRYACTCGGVYYPDLRTYTLPLWLRWPKRDSAIARDAVMLQADSLQR